ncbi:hypothetical protein K2173_021252 [Erythroxylum novogranatense]|uniref:SMP-LTD domain-containing protein n=1 Tax=Erythroxylum novogranatense TaxID=1862640 RepID=A0AAV8TMZ9_9ROSI|nr:hypothetical protein K2173_021252 [Erythroxylum novogranatense]
MFMWLVIFGGGFFVGALTLVALEALGVYVFIRRLKHKSRLLEAKPLSGSSSRDLDPQQSLDFAFNKKGVVWILESDKIDKLPKEYKRRKDLLEVTPRQKYARIKDQLLCLTDPDGSRVAIPLKGCTVEAVSGNNLCSRKWVKRFPVRIENKTSTIYNGSKTIYLYLETSWEKESWCKALRLASCDDREKLNWFTKLNEEFHCYLTSLNTGYPSFMKPSVGFNEESVDRMSKVDGSTSKVRTFFKRISRKAPKNGMENRGASTLGHEDKKVLGKCRSLQDPIAASSLIKTALPEKMSASSEEENMPFTSSSNFSRSQSQTYSCVSCERESDDKPNVDEGTLCWNLLISRLFFDAKCNTDVKSSIQARIQRSLSNMRLPGYIGDVICKDLDLGNIPPYIHGIRVLPTDMNEVWAWEMDLEYYGGMVLNIETRLEVRDQDLQKGVADTRLEPSSNGDVSSDLLEGFEYLGKQLNLPEETVDARNQRDKSDPRLDGLKNSTNCTSTSTNVSKWKSILNSVAKHVSQVPITLSIRIASLRGTLRLHIKPPPSDRLWIGFTSMPEIEFNLESSLGEHKISNGHIALFLINRFKASIREALVLPNCESVCIPWMLAEKNDWVPRKVAPFVWVNQEGPSDPAATHAAFSCQSDEAKTKTEASGGTVSDPQESKHQKSRNAQGSSQSISNSRNALIGSLSPSRRMSSSKSLQELGTPLLASGEPQEVSERECTSQHPSPSRPLSNVEKQSPALEEDNLRPKKLGRRARMLDLGKKMGEKFEERRRHIEEKSRNIVEKMRGT